MYTPRAAAEIATTRHEEAFTGVQDEAVNETSVCDKEFEKLVLLGSGCEFTENNVKMRFCEDDLI